MNKPTSTPPGTKHQDIKPCIFCGQGVGACGQPDFFVMSLSRYIFNARAIQRQTGLEQMLGHPAIAQVMGANEDMGTHVVSALEVWVCASCAYMEPQMLINAMDKPVQDDEGTFVGDGDLVNQGPLNHD